MKKLLTCLAALSITISAMAARHDSQPVQTLCPGTIPGINRTVVALNTVRCDLEYPGQDDGEKKAEQKHGDNGFTHPLGSARKIKQDV